MFTKCSKFIDPLISNFTFFNQSSFSKNLNPHFDWSKKENISVPRFSLQGSESRKKDIKKTQANKIKKNIKRENINKDLYTATKIIF